MKKIQKSDAHFLIAIAFFAVVSFSRFFDEKIKNHVVLFDFMQEYEWAIVFTTLYFIVLLCLFAVCILNCENSNKKNLYYLITFYSVFAFPMYLTSKYFGVVDIYAWMLTWLAIMFVVSARFEWFVVVLSFLISLISPMSILSCGCILVTCYIYKYLVFNEKKYLLIAITCVVTGGIGVLVSYNLGKFSTDVQNVLSLERFLGMIIFLCPYLYIAGVFLKGLIKNAVISKKWAYLVLIIGVVPSALVYIGVGDYARSIFNVFSYFILSIVICLILKDNDVAYQLERTKDLIKKWIPIPVLIMVIPFLFMTLWISGQQHLMKEVFINK